MSINEALRQIPIVDVHQHFWCLGKNYYPWLCDPTPVHFRYGDYSSIKRDYMPVDYLRDVGTNRVVKTIHEEAWWNPADPVGETTWVTKVAQEYGLPTALVANGPLNRDSIEQILNAHAASPLTRGIRNFPNSAASAREANRGQLGSMDDPKWRRGYEQLRKYDFSADIQTPWWHFDALCELAADFPVTQIIIVHTGLPSDRSAEGLAGWRDALEKVAVYPNVAIKISGIGQPGLKWSVQSNAPIIRDAIRIFGVNRSMFASNFPVDSLVGSFDMIYNGFRLAVAPLSLSDQRKLFHDNAIRIYRL